MGAISGWSGRRVVIPAILLWVFGVCGALQASQVTFVGSLGSLEATATFKKVGMSLFVMNRDKISRLCHLSRFFLFIVLWIVRMKEVFSSGDQSEMEGRFEFL